MKARRHIGYRDTDRPPLNPLADLKASLSAHADCTHHPEIAVSTSRAAAALWWESFALCSSVRRMEHLRWMGQHDLFFLLRWMLKRTHLDTEFHFARCQDIVAHPNNHIDLWFRGSGKSELLTYGQIIRDILNNPEICIGIFSHNRPLAKGFLRVIKREFETNELLQDVYPDIFWRDPERESPKWALATETPVLTTVGWKRHGDLVPGDNIYGSAGTVISVVGNSGPMHDVPCRLLTFDDCQLIASSDHLWSVHCRKSTGGAWNERTTTTRLLTTDELTIRTHTQRLPATPLLHTGGMARPNIPAYVLGYWLGNGTAGTNIITMHRQDEVALGAVFGEFGCELYIHRRKPKDNFTMYGIRGLKRSLEAEGCLRDKHVPPSYLDARAGVRLELLQGLMDSDGTCKSGNGHGMCTFSNTNSALAHAAFHLAASLGLRPSMFHFMPKSRARKMVYHVYFVGLKSTPPFRLQRKLERCKEKRHRVGRYLKRREVIPSVTVNCIKVDAPDGMYLVGRCLVPTHNSEDHGIEVKRKSIRKESTIEAWGLVDALPVGKRYNILHYDDVVSRREITMEMIDKVVREFENSLALTASDPPLFRYLATYQEIGDLTYQLVQKKWAPVRCHPAIDADGNPVLLSAEALAFQRTGMSPKTFALQYLLDPTRATTDAQIGFDPQWVRVEKQVEVKSLHVYLLVDPAGKAKAGTGHSRFAAGVVGVDCHKTWHLLDAIVDKLNLAERADATINLFKKWPVLKIGYETYGMQSDIEYLRERAKTENVQITVVGLGGHMDKDSRIEQLIPLFKSGHFVLPSAGIWYITKAGQRLNLVEEFLTKEYPLWPYGAHKDMLDMLARCCDERLGVTIPRAYAAAGFSHRDPWTAGNSSGSWMSE